VAWFATIPIETRLAVLFAIGAALGGMVNWAIYSLAWSPRAISPWSRLKDARRYWTERIPIFGWLLLRRHAPEHGAGFWIRPMLIELAMGVGIATLYWWEIVTHALSLPPDVNIGTFGSSDWTTIAHAQFLSHVVLIVFMAVATFIDLDEMLIPDTVTIPGTLLGGLLAFLNPWSLLPGLCWIPAGAVISEREFLQINSPNHWPMALSNAAGPGSLWLALGCWWGWCFAILPRRWLPRRGRLVALRILGRRLIRENFTWLVVGLGAVGSALLIAAWALAGPASWAGLLTALVGMAVAGGWTWLVRIVCSQAIGREAMGFGDVTLMAMIGTFLGWQAALIAFFLAPITGALMGVAMWLIHRSRVLPFGPYLCLGALVVVIFWRDIWQFIAFHFSLGWLIPGVLVVGIVLMGVLLAAWRAVLAMFEPFESDPSR
jgi:prepilin signal peptidase PulO-like enzyme (type II secretory pathway)